MEEKFLAFIQERCSLQSGDRILLAVSGGVDSMVMLDLFRKQGWPIAIAHCNFQLRGKASDADASLVNEVADQHDLPFHLRQFETATISTTTGKGLQETARDLRYAWFAELLKDHNLDCVATAHHQDDHIETAIMHLVRGCGIDGLVGISARRDHIIRPFLFASKQEIITYAKAHKINYREDESNYQLKYQRNYLRTKILPLLREMNPNFDQRMVENMEIWTAEQQVLKHHLQTCLDQRLRNEGGIQKLKFEEGDSEQLKKQIIYHWVGDLGFSTDQINNISTALNDDRTGALFIGTNHQGLINRGEFHLRETRSLVSEYLIAANTNRIHTAEGILQLDIINHNQLGNLSQNPKEEYLDADLLQFPLLLRRWKPGDYFHPLGQTGKQKLKKFLANEKLSRFEKEHIWLVISDDKICMIVGKRIDERFKVTAQSMTLLQLRWDENS